MSDQKVTELFTRDCEEVGVDWPSVLRTSYCEYISRKCIKIRKSDPDTAIGTCTVKYGSESRDIIICPHRLLQGGRIFSDAVHLLESHQPGNDLHLIPEFTIPGGSVDYVLVSTRRGRAVDFAGIELQTLDSTGTVWPARQRFLQSVGVPARGSDDPKRYGMNWKMTAKTILVQLHHKVRTFENVDRKLVLVLQDCLLNYMRKEFNFGHLASPPRQTDSLHFHAYDFERERPLTVELVDRASTDDDGMAAALGLQAEPNVDLEDILGSLTAKLSPANRFSQL